MINEFAILKRNEFADLRPVGPDDKKVSLFHSKLADVFQFSLAQPIAIIVVAHPAHSLPYFLDLITQLGKIMAIILKESNYVDSVQSDIEILYKDYIQHGLNKKVLQEDAVTTRKILTKIFNDPSSQKYQFIILDHGGYFAPSLHILLEEPFVSRLVGIVEHTWNGELRYQRFLQESSIRPFPVFSIARSALKAREIGPVAQSFIIALMAIIYGGAGLNQELNRLTCIGIVGFGYLGKEIACLLRSVLYKNVTIKICDCAPEACHEAKKLGFFVSQELGEVIDSADLIITATSDIALTREHIHLMKDNVCLACVTSHDD